MDYFELHITKKNLERLVYILLIIILSIISIFAYKKAPSECVIVECKYDEQPAVTAPVVQRPTKNEATEEIKVSYVDIEKLRFAPKELIIRNNTVVVFRNKEVATAHKVYEAHGLFLGSRMLPGDSFNYTFVKLGNYTVYSVVGKDQGTRMKIEVIP